MDGSWQGTTDTYYAPTTPVQAPVVSSSSMTLETHPKGVPRAGYLLAVLVFFVFVSIVMFWGAVLLFIKGQEPGFETFNSIAFMLVIFGIIAIAIGVHHMVPITIEMNDYGLRFKKGKNILDFTWAEMVEIKSRRSLGYYQASTAGTNLNINIRTATWKHEIKDWKFGLDNTKAAFIYMAERTIPIGIKVEDQLGWLPAHLYDPKKVHLGYMLEYAVLGKVGLYMVLIGLIFAPMIILVEWAIIGAMSMITIGGMCCLAGLTGFYDEKGKLDKKEAEEAEKRK